MNTKFTLPSKLEATIRQLQAANEPEKLKAFLIQLSKNFGFEPESYNHWTILWWPQKNGRNLAAVYCDCGKFYIHKKFSIKSGLTKRCSACHFTNPAEQNKERAKRYLFEGQELSAVEIAAKLGISRQRVDIKIKHGKLKVQEVRTSKNQKSNDSASIKRSHAKVLRTTKSLRVRIGEHSYTEVQWLQRTKISFEIYRTRLANGWSQAWALTTPAQHIPSQMSITVGTETHSLMEWAEIYRVSEQEIMHRLPRGLDRWVRPSPLVVDLPAISQKIGARNKKP